ncbi:GAP family protein [Nesterenkonia alba]|uniref:GAP family protein n=1 Tax=Nesterenkonia alba TaxID=515814 RepID=UPI0003B343AF|nr:GAP family protein [Nesterenkonia alba]
MTELDITALLGDGADGPWALLGILAVLALIDSTSFGTLLIPVWLLMAPGRLRAARLVMYLGVVAGAYAVIGVVLLAGLLLYGDQVLSSVSAAQQSQPFLIGQAALAAVLIWYSMRLDPWTEAGKEKKRRREAARGTADRVGRFRNRAVGEGAQGGLGALLALALAAVGLEIATLIPYLAGIGLVSTAAPELPGSVLMILFYCAVMISPALVLLLGRVVAHRLLERPLAALESFLSRHANGTIALILFLLGLFLGLNALEGLQDPGL